ncbi:MAG: polyprenyl synthetase family protein [bacterium]
MTRSGLKPFLTDSARKTDRALQSILTTARATGTLKKALVYSLFPGGKRFRPALFMAAYQALRGKEEKAWRPAASLELAHTFTLLQDDLPPFDDDDYRRGKPTVHRKFSESTAILASDILLLLALRAIATSEFSSEIRGQGAVELADALGAAGVIGGQFDDLEIRTARLTISHLLEVNRRKTGALMKGASRLGATFAGATEDDIKALGHYGECVGMAFQIADDLADNQNEHRLRRSKISMGRLRKAADAYVEKAVGFARPYRSKTLDSLADFALHRTC